MTTTVTLRIDDKLKADAEKLFETIGLNMTTAFTCFLKKCLAVGGIPFPIRRKHRGKRSSKATQNTEEDEHMPNDETRAILDRDMAGLEPSYGPFDSTEEMLKAALDMED